ncbi:ankyrin repeat domain-containing protein [Wolbachia endosymbiont (group B) of Endotricha flammealis]|uniref:ankyrin repeat domain-containing protein n=1 Tax=Wolbachia endosymbiont (group B) of Endotricha flammealis TaxID=2954005 RepID=UPI002232A798|nr:ankyrin repeat domain-containing protein [Wolbachia endosymbiont (group B) of Endotricha flammealis]
MFKIQYPTDHLKKEDINSKITELSDEVQYIEQAREFSQLKRYRRSDVDSESGSQIKRIDVPGDGSCLFWSVTMAYLIPVRNDDALFRQRYEVLFGNDGTVTQNLDHIRGLVRNLGAANYDDTFANLVRNVFRNRVVDHISSYRNEFRDFVEGDFERYLENMRNPDTWGGEPEIRAMSGMLSATISVSGEVETQYGNGDIQIQLFHVGAPGKRNHYNFGLERNIIDNDKELAKGLKRVMGKVRPQDFELIQLLIEEADKEVGISRQDEDFKSFEPRFQSFVDQIPSYLHSVEKAGFFTHFFLGSFSTLLDTEMAKKLDIKEIYFSFDGAKTLKVAIIKNGEMKSQKDVIDKVKLFVISESGSHSYTQEFDQGELKEVLGKLYSLIENNLDKIKVKSIKIIKDAGHQGEIVVDVKDKGVDIEHNSEVQFKKVRKGLWRDPEVDIAKLAISNQRTVKASLRRILDKIYTIHSEYADSLIYASRAREAAHHGFMVGVFMNFHYRYNLRVYPEQFAGRGYADIILLARGPDRALNSIPIIIELKAGAGPNATPDKALQQAERYAQGFQPNVMRVLTTADEILCVGVNLDSSSPISNIGGSSREGRVIPLFQDILKSADDWDTQEIYTNALKKRIKNNMERIYHTFPGTPEKGDNHYFSRFLLGQLLLLSEDSGTSLKKYIFIYGGNIPTEVHPNLRRLRRPAAERARERLSANLDASHAVVTMVLIPENTEKLVYVINIIEANRKDVLNMLNEVLPLDRLNREIGNREIVELNLNFDTRYKSDFRRYLTIWTEKYNSLQEYNNGAERFQGTFKEVPYPNELKETFDKALDIQSLSIKGYSGLLEKIGEGIFPFKSLVNKEAHFQGILNGVFSYYSDLKLQESPETRALVLTEFQTGRGERIDMLVHGIKFVAQGGNAEEYTPIGLELKTSRQGKGAKALLREANDQINEEYKEGVTYKTLTDGDEVKFIGVVFDKGSNNPNKLILTSRTAKEGFIPVGVVHSSVHMLPTVGQCSKGEKREPSSPEYPPSKKPRRERSVNMACKDSFDEEEITEEEKEQRIKELFNADKVAERVKNIEFYDQLFKVSERISRGETIDQNVEEAFIAKVKNIDLSSIDPEIRDIVKEMKDNIENKEEMKNILRRSGVAEKIGKVAEGAGLAFTVFLVGKHIANGDVEGLGYDALNLWVMPKIGEKISGKMLELGTKLDSQMLKGFAPVMGRAIGNFAAFLGLAESIKARENATDPVDVKIADLNIATNSIFIAADVPAVVTETMSAIGMEAGVIGEFAGPVGAAISVAVIIISQFVEAELEVEKLTEQMSLTDQEKHDLYWDFFLSKKLPDYIGNDLQAEEIYKQYISKILDQFKGSYDKIAISLPSILLTEEKYLDGSIFRRKREVMQSDDASAYLGITPCFRHTRIVDNKFDFRLITRVSDISLNVKSGNNHISRLLPSTMKNYSAICGPKGDDVDLTVISEKTLQRVEGVAQCGYRSEYENMVLSTTVKKVSLKEYLPGCQNAIMYSKSSSSRLPANMLFYIPNNDAFINVTSNYTIDVIFNGKNILLNSYGIDNQGSSVQNRYYFTDQLSNCDIHKQGTNFFYIAKDNFVCNLGGSSTGQNNIVVTRGNFADSENIHSVIGSSKANHIEVSHAGYVDGKGGNDVITAKNFTTIKGYFGDSIRGKGLVLLPINFSDIGSMTHANNITNIYNKSGAFISVDKQTSVKTADGLFVTPTKVDINTDRVTNVHITKLDNKLDNLQKMDNSNFNITKQLLNTNYHGVVGSSSNHIFYPDEDHHNFYWKAPSNISHLYLFDNRNANIMIAQANGILDFSLLNSTLNDMPFIEDNKGEIKINKNGLNITLLSNYKDVTVTFNGEEYYKLQNGELERDYCSHSLKVDGRFSVNGTNLLNHHNCFTFDSEKVLFLKLNNDLLLLSDRGALSISDYYSSVHKNWDLSIELSDKIMEPEEFGERADEFSSFRYYKPDEQGLQIYHNQPVNKNDIGLVDLKDKSILDFNMRVINDTLLLSHKNNTLVKVENWNTYQPAREMMFAFNDAIVSNSKCIASICNSEDVIVEFNKEKAILSTEQLFDAVRRNNLSEVKNLLSMGADVNIRDRRGWAPLHYASDNDNKLDTSRAILNRNANIEAKTNIGETPLHIANAYGQLKIIELLIDKRANIEAKTNDGLTPLHVAIQHNNTTPKIIEFLIDKGVNIEAKIKDDQTPLHHAVFKDRLDIVRVLSSRGANIEAKTSDGKTPLDLAIQGNYTDIVGFLKQTELDKKLLTATENGDLSEVKKFVGQGASVNAIEVGIFGRKPIHIAAEKNYKDIIEFLLGKEVSVDDTSNYGWTPLHYTASKGCLEVAKFLIDKGASVNAQNVYGREPIHIAAEHDNKNIIELLLNKGVSVNEVDKDGWMSLHWASWNGHLNIIEYLVGKGANVNAKDRNGKTPLDLARDKGYNNVVEYLQQTQLGLDRQLLTAVQGGNLNEVKDFVVRGASLDTQDSNNGWTPIIYAAQGSKWDAVKFLIAQGAKFNNEITYQGTPLHFAAQEGNSNMVQFLLDKGANIEAQDAYNRKPLHIAVDVNRLNVVNLLLDRGANLKATDMYGKTSLDLAIQKGYEDIVEVLKQKQLNLDKELLIAAEKGDLEKVRESIRRGANVNIQDRQGWTPLFWAIQKNNFNIIELLLDNSADIKVKDNEGWTPLHWAVQLGSLNVVKYFVEKGADVNALTADGRAPLDIAKDKGHNKIVEYLEEKLSEGRGGRKRRHHHGDHSRHHLSRKPLAINSSNQPEIAASSGIRPFSWINYCISLVKSSVGRLLSSQSEGTASSVSQFDGQFAKASISNSSLTGTTLPSDDTDKRQKNGGFFRDNVDYVNANLKRMCERQAPVKFKPKGRNTILEMGDHYLSQVDFNGTIILFDLLIRRFTGQKYISTVDQSISPLEAQGYALNITKGFEKVVEQAGLKSGVSMHRLNIDYMGMQKDIVRKVVRGQFNEISGVLSSYLEKACPSREAGCPGKLSSKKFDKFIAQFNNGLLSQSIEQILHNGDGRLEVDGAKQMNLEPQSYLSNASVHSYSEVSNCLSEIGVTKLGGNLNR